MTLEQPTFLIGWLLLIPSWWLWLRSDRYAVMAFSNTTITQGLGGSLLLKASYAAPIFRLSALALSIFALAGPSLVSSEGTKSSEGIDIMMAVDTSGSMAAIDFVINGEPSNRLEVIKSVITEFIAKRPSDRIGIVVFGDQAFTQAPMTLDHEVLKSFIQASFIGMAGRATAIGDSIAVATKRLKDLEAPSKVLILLTDGTNTAGQVAPIEAAKAAATLGIKIYTIGIGSTGEVPFPTESLFGRSVQNQLVELDETLLKEIAALSAGAYFNAKNTEQLKAIYEQIDRLEKSKKDTKTYRHVDPLYPQVLLLALLCLGLEGLILTTGLRRLPS